MKKMKAAPELIVAMKRSLMTRVQEWLGFDIPSEGTEDYERWLAMTEEVEGIETLADVVDYLESEGMDVEDFMAEFEE